MFFVEFAAFSVGSCCHRGFGGSGLHLIEGLIILLFRPVRGVGGGGGGEERCVRLSNVCGLGTFSFPYGLSLFFFGAGGAEDVDGAVNIEGLKEADSDGFETCMVNDVLDVGGADENQD